MPSATVSLTTAFIDLSTFDEIETWLYGGRSVNRFRKCIRRCAWFTVIAAQLNKVGTVGDFDSEMQAMFSRAGDYIRDCWLRVELPAITTQDNYQCRWTKNIGHNLIDEAYLQFNDLTVNKLTSYHMDFLSQFCVSESKRAGYDYMIGNHPALVDPYAGNASRMTPNANGGISTIPLPATSLNIPLPFWFTRDPSDAILQAACPFNDIKVTVKFRGWRELLVVDELSINQNGGYKTTTNSNPTWGNVFPSTNTPRLSGCEVWAHYAVVPNADREKIADEENIDVVCEQIQHIPVQPFNPSTQPQVNVPLRFSTSVRALFFALRNISNRSEWSNYSTHASRGTGVGTDDDTANAFAINLANPNSRNPLARAVLAYENVDRVNMYADYYTHVTPYYTATRIPSDIGYHLLPYCNDISNLQPDGSTNYARLASVHLTLEASADAVTQAGDVNSTAGDASGVPYWDRAAVYKRSLYDVVVTASTLSILRMTGGSAGFPVL